MWSSCERSDHLKSNYLTFFDKLFLIPSPVVTRVTATSLTTAREEHWKMAARAGKTSQTHEITVS